jgi:hypothetical protein
MVVLSSNTGQDIGYSDRFYMVFLKANPEVASNKP